MRPNRVGLALLSLLHLHNAAAFAAMPANDNCTGCCPVGCISAEDGLRTECADCRVCRTSGTNTCPDAGKGGGNSNGDGTDDVQVVGTASCVIALEAVNTACPETPDLVIDSGQVTDTTPYCSGACNDGLKHVIASCEDDYNAGDEDDDDESPTVVATWLLCQCGGNNGGGVSCDINSQNQNNDPVAGLDNTPVENGGGDGTGGGNGDGTGGGNSNGGR